MNKRILVSGASIAGLTLAYRLTRHDFQVTVVERAERLRAGGNGVDVRDQATDVVAEMGLLPQIRAAATDVHGMKFVDAADRAVARIDIRDPASLEIMRGDLVALLHGVTDVEYLFGDWITAIRQDGDGVTVDLASGGTRRFDLLVGADGLHSATRRLAFGPEADYLTFKDHYFAFADADSSLGEDRWVTMFNTPGKMTGLYRSGNHTQAKAYFIFRSKPIAFDHRDVGEHKRLVRDAFGGDRSWRIPQLLDAALADPEFYFDALSQVRMPAWSTGRVALTGDAAWCASPASGAGAELALVGAYRLAEELAAAEGDHRIAFARYHSALRGLVAKKQRIGVNVRVMVPRTEGGRRVRDFAARLRSGRN
ncbi:FAD-dependent monooxygenase [Hamadaea sp. NPDC051192]|uniref:FAD-dependent monooxygenase n=1 Tax=Hamadaea sp. NPDC051192 TaxID=3154940 RepID=UPI00343361B2